MEWHDLDTFARAYVECAIWATTIEDEDENITEMDEGYSIEDVTAATLDTMAKTCADFQAAHADDLAAADEQGRDAGACGHDLWLTRNGHGAGFWGRELGAVGDRLSDAAKALGEAHLFPNDNGGIELL